MRISRVSTGFIMIGISIFLFLSALLADDSELGSPSLHLSKILLPCLLLCLWGSAFI
jgi:hypothetical protein